MSDDRLVAIILAHRARAATATPPMGLGDTRAAGALAAYDDVLDMLGYDDSGQEGDG